MKLTIIIPVYNVHDYISDCIKSLLSQSFSNFQAIVVDDASTDDSLLLAKREANNDDRFLFLSQEKNGGQSVARNEGLAHAEGDYVAFLDSDDYYAQDALLNMVESLQKDDLDMLYFAAETLYETRELARSHPEKQTGRKSIPGVLSGAQMFTRMENTGSFRPSSCLYIAKRSLIENNSLRFEKDMINEDLLFQMLLIPYASRVAFLNEPLYFRRMRRKSTMTQPPSIRNVNGLFSVSLRMSEWISANGADYDTSFVDAYTHRLSIVRDDAARYVLELRTEEVEQYRKSLSFSKRLDFDEHIYNYAMLLKGVYNEIMGSRTYKFGRFFMAFPSWIKTHLLRTPK